MDYEPGSIKNTSHVFPDIVFITNTLSEEFNDLHSPGEETKTQSSW